MCNKPSQRLETNSAIYYFTGEFIWVMGKYIGRNFRWMVENCPGYVGWFVGDVIKDCLRKKVSSDAHHEAHKEAIVVNTFIFLNISKAQYY